MATVRIGDFSGGTSEVLDPSLIAPNAAVASYNLDPRAGVFSPVLDALEVTTLSAPHIDWIEYDGGHTRLDTHPDASFVRWGDYLLYVYPGAVGANYAAKFNSTTGERTESRPLGIAEVTAAENATVSLAPIRATALTFKDGEHNLSGEIQANIEAAANDPSKQYQTAIIHRYSMGIFGSADVPYVNVAAGDWIVILPPAQPEGASGDVFVGRPGCVTEVVSQELNADTGRPYIVLSVSLFGWLGRGVVRSDAFGIEGLAETDSAYSEGFGVALFKRDTKSLAEIVAFARSVSSRSATNYINPMLSAEVAEAFVEYSDGVYGTYASRVLIGKYGGSLYDYALYRQESESLQTLLVNPTVAGQSFVTDTAILPYDFVTYKDESPGAVEARLTVLGVQSLRGITLGLSAGIYRYAVTRVDDWGRESAPWPYLLEAKDRPKIDATTEAAAESTLGALFVGVGGLPQVPADWKLNIYRTRADGSQYYFLRKLDTGADFVDTVSDFDLSVVPMLAEQNYPPLVVPVDEEAKVFEQAPPQFLCEYRGVLFSAYKNRLMFSAPGKFYAWPPGNWYLLPSTITGILPAGDVLLVFTRTRTFRLTGNTFSTADFREVSDEYGCVANRTACLVDKRPFWCSLGGVATFDGVRVVVVTDGLLKDNSTRFAGAVAACSYRQEYYLILTPTGGSKADASPTENESKSLHYLRFKPGAWLIHGRFPAAMTDIAHNPSDGCLYTVGGGKLWKLFAGKGRAPGFWKSGRLHGGIKGLVKTGQWWGVVVEEAPIRVTIEADGGTEITTRDLDPGSHYIDFRDGAEFRDLTFSFGGRGVVTEYSFEFQEGKPQ